MLQPFRLTAPRGAPELAPVSLGVERSAMRFDGHDPIDPEPEEGANVVLSPPPLDAAESSWDPLLWALYLREIAEQKAPTVH